MPSTRTRQLCCGLGVQLGNRRGDGAVPPGCVNGGLRGGSGLSKRVRYVCGGCGTRAAGRSKSISNFQRPRST
eukprot:2516340-Prymnesium_polylepis.1